MKPALSLVFFTVLSGAGLGLAVMATLFPAAMSPDAFTAAAIASLLLVAAGLGASAGHLANPKNAWRAVMRARTSWLSREAVLAALFFPLTLLYAFADEPAAALRTLVALVALLTIFCTAMIYQSLKTIPQWHHPCTAFNYLALALMSGGALFNLFTAAPHPASLILTLLFTAAAAAGKWYHYRRIGRCRDISVGQATGFSQAKARLLDAGHTGPTFLTREFIFHRPAAQLQRYRYLACGAAFVAPLLLPPMLLLGFPVILPALMAALMTAGLLLERWLFFAEAHHSVRAYHGID